jgi:hypothetical protein
LKAKTKDSGKLRIGDDWNAIRIIALSQSNPLKAIAEFVENRLTQTLCFFTYKRYTLIFLAILSVNNSFI